VRERKRERESVSKRERESECCVITVLGSLTNKLVRNAGELT